MTRMRRRRQVHFVYRGRWNRKMHKEIRGLPDFTALDAARRRVVIGTNPAGALPFAPGVEQPRRLIRLPEGELERIRAQVDAHIAELERQSAIPKAAT